MARCDTRTLECLTIELSSPRKIYSQVQSLFKDAPDLLSEFKNFLPTEGVVNSYAPDMSRESLWDDMPERRGGPVPKRKKKAQEGSFQPPAPGGPSASSKVTSIRVSISNT
jgi:histone deacetylase complex regulatory component SIN3